MAVRGKKGGAVAGGVEEEKGKGRCYVIGYAERKKQYRYHIIQNHCHVITTTLKTDPGAKFDWFREFRCHVWPKMYLGVKVGQT